jgi:hypothetical protein
MTGLFAISVLLSQTGCTAIGFTVGSLYDDHHAGVRAIKSHDLVTVPPGKPIFIKTIQGDTLSGIYPRRTSISLTDYAIRFAEYQRTIPHNKLVPAPGDSVVIHAHKFGGGLRARIAAYDVDALYAYNQSDSNLQKFTNRKIRSIIDRKGRVYDGKIMRQNIVQHHIPVLSVLNIQTTGALRKVPMSDIQEIHAWQKGKAGRKTGLAIGAPIDCTILLFLYLLSTIDLGTYP